MTEKSDTEDDALDFNFLNNAGNEMLQWSEQVRKLTNCKNVTKSKVSELNIQTLANCLFEGYQAAQASNAKYEAAKVCLEKIKTEMITLQRTVLKLQQQLLENQSNCEQLSAAVDSAVKNGIRSYSEVLSDTVRKSVPVLSATKLKKAVKEAVSDDDRSRNVVVFGLEEQESVHVDSQITDLFNVLDEKPSFQAVRIGLQPEDESIRPVKISFRNAEIAHRILTKAKNLKSSTNYRKVYISPDRTPEERIKHRQLVAEMRQLAADNPEQRFFIFRGEICNVDK